MYIFVIDTDSYAGNFEREITAYMTGCVGDCEVGSDQAQIFKEEIREGFFDDLIVWKPDEDGCHRPCIIWDTPGWFNDGMGGHWRDGQETEAKASHRQKCLDRANDLRSIHPKDADNHKKRWIDAADEPLVKHPAYNSVAIYMSRRPTEEEVRLLRERASKWTKKTPQNILGFRLIEKVTEYNEEQKWEVE